MIFLNLENLITAAEQETHIIGNLYRQGKAFVDSVTSDETYSDAARRIEAERQEAIFEKFPEFKGKEEDAKFVIVEK